MKTVNMGEYRFVFGELFDGNLQIQTNAENTKTTMDGRVVTTVPIDMILDLVADHFVKPALIGRISELDSRSALLGTV